ncbi:MULTISPECIES: N-acetylmuramoyl-L-alanine amidase [unclassified Sphingomonas]|uniref:N-acetylmuramoyl-L-alanine amidase n=1 Tax=unclassified Sphingomonas TaxID=196159 RepID=UPI002151483C|nr:MULTISPECIES: N-acetylmuramoyl-L-alanine amidase [unclassified Sphingomonas]MCR5870698.1 N-acetylmuramoyl-L-alanine amidase [Sphingomonas sp. J344]UUY00967.1 N-acetylmuramoyl-L-alanine amidase [Sphingomonas sp. J315]
MRKITHLVVHCSATPEGRDVSAKEIDGWHRQRGFARIGYHYVVRLDGTVESGRPLEQPGAHVAGHNANTIGIVYAGGLAKDGKTPKDTRTAAQKVALTDLLKSLKRRFPNAIVQGHRDFSPDLDKDGKVEPHEYMKACPSFDAKSEYAKL